MLAQDAPGKITIAARLTVHIHCPLPGAHQPIFSNSCFGVNLSFAFGDGLASSRYLNHQMGGLRMCIGPIIPSPFDDRNIRLWLGPA